MNPSQTPPSPPSKLDKVVGLVRTSSLNSKDSLRNSPPTRSAALTKLRRGASIRQAPSDSPPLPKIDSTKLNPSPLTLSIPSPPAISHQHTNSDDSPLYSTPVALDRTASLLARSMAMAKLTGSAPPTAPSSYYINSNGVDGFSSAPLPTLGALRERAEMRINGSGRLVAPGLRRNHTVTGVGIRSLEPNVVSPPAEIKIEDSVALDRAEARSNLMRKLSARRLAPVGALAVNPATLAVVGMQGKLRPRSGSLGEGEAAPGHDWLNQNVPPLPPAIPLPTVNSLHRSNSAHSPNNSTPKASAQHSNSRLAITTSPLFITPERMTNFHPARATNVEEGNVRDMRGRLQAAELEAEENGQYSDDDNDTSAARTVVGTTNSTPRLFGEFEWNTSRPTTEEFEPYDEEDDGPPSPFTRTSATSLASTSGSAGSSARISEASFGPVSDNVPLVLRRGSIPQHLLSGRFPSSISTLASIEASDPRAQKVASFGIGAVEDIDVRRRGSSACSVLGFVGGNYRASDAGFVFNESRLGINSGDLGQSTLSLGLDGSSIDSGRSDSVDTIEYLENRSIGLNREEAMERRTVEIELGAKVERQREIDMSRNVGGVEAGYQFPPNPSGNKSTTQANAQTLYQAPVEELLPHPFENSRAPQSPKTVQRSPLSNIALPAFSPPLLPLLDSSKVKDPRHSISPKFLDSSRLFTPTKELESIPLSRNGSGRSAHSLSPTNSLKKPDSVQSGDRSGYSSSNEMKRDLSSSSSGSFQFEPRQARMYSEDLPANRILRRLDSILGPEEFDSNSPSALDNPPRKLLLHAPVLQVVNANTVKDRHLFLFNDLLLIAKPIIRDDPKSGQPLPSTLDSTFIVKSIVELRHLKLVAMEEPVDDSATKKRHPLLVAFVDRFANDPKRAIASLIQKGGLANDGATIANLLFRNPDLNRNQLGAYLSERENKHTLRLYIERFRFSGVRLDDALRVFLMSVRLPNDAVAVEYVLSVVAAQWTETNGVTGFDPSLTLSLVLAIMKLSDALHATAEETTQFSLPNTAISVDDFIAAFRERDTRLLVPEELLVRIYASVRKERIETASDNSIFSMTPDIEAKMSPAKLPTRLTYRTASELITITIPEPDSKFNIKLHGTDLKFEPNHLSFAKSNSQSFRVTGSALGIRAMILIKYGQNAPRYQGLALNKAFSIERAFMQQTFQISFVNHLDVKRKYMFSTLDHDLRIQWTKLLRDRIESQTLKPPPISRELLAGEMVAVSILRDALIIPEDIPPLTSFAAPQSRHNTAAPPRFGTSGALLPSLLMAAPRSARLGTGASNRSGFGGILRSNSISKTYASGIGKVESDLIPVSTVINGGRKGSQGILRGLGNKEEGNESLAKNGKELVLITVQNSLLPLVLSFLRAGVSEAPHPLSIDGSAFQHRPISPT